MLRKRMIAGPLAILACLSIMTGLTHCEGRRTDDLTIRVSDTKGLTSTEVAQVAAQAVEAAQFYAPNSSVVITITDREGRILFQGATVDQSTGQSAQTQVTAENSALIGRSTARALTGSYFSSEGEAFSGETAFFIIQENFPPGTKNEDVGPLFGVENSSFASSDIIQASRFDVREDTVRPQLGMPVRNLMNNSNEVVDPALGITPHPTVTAGTGTVGIGTNTVPDAGVVNIVVNVQFGAPDASGAGPLHRQGAHVGGLGIAGNIDFQDIGDILIAGSFNLMPPPEIRGDRVVVDGVRFQYARTVFRRAPVLQGRTLQQLIAQNLVHVIQGPRSTLQTSTTNPFDTLRQIPPQAYVLARQQTIANALASPEAQAQGITDGPTAAKLFGINVITTSANKVSIDLPRRGTLLGDIKDQWRRSPNQAENPANLNATRDFRQVIASNALDLTDVSTIIRNAADTALNQRAGIRRPLGLNAVVHFTVCDQNGVNLGSFAMEDATVFSYDVAFQKGRGCAFFSDNRVAWAARSIGWVAQPHFPPGIDTTSEGPCFGIQALYNPLGNILHPALNGFQVFPGGLPIYQNGELVGAVGISGDGVDQDDQISFGGTAQPFGTPGFVRVDLVDDDQKVASLRRSVTKMQGATVAAINNLNAQAPLNASQQATLAQLTTLQQRLNAKLEELKNPNRLTNVPIPWFKFARAPLLSDTD